jgi:hypothetical protein
VARLVLDTILEAVFEHSSPLTLELPSVLQTVPTLGTREVTLDGLESNLGIPLPQKLVLLAPLEPRQRCPKHL